MRHLQEVSHPAETDWRSITRNATERRRSLLVQPSIRNNYLETDVMTATPQKLQYMLIDAAIRNIQRGKHLRSENQDEAACEVLIRAQQIVTHHKGVHINRLRTKELIVNCYIPAARSAVYHV